MNIHFIVSANIFQLYELLRIKNGSVAYQTSSRKQEGSPLVKHKNRYFLYIKNLNYGFPRKDYIN